MKGILLLIFIAILLGLSSFQSQSAYKKVSEQSRIEQDNLAANILSTENEVGKALKQFKLIPKTDARI